MNVEGFTFQESINDQYTPILLSNACLHVQLALSQCHNFHCYSILTSENLIDNLYICMSFLSTSLVTRRWDFCSLRPCMPAKFPPSTDFRITTVFYRPTNTIRGHILGICSESFMILSVPSWFHLTCQCALPDPMQDQIIWKGSNFMKPTSTFLMLGWKFKLWFK